MTESLLINNENTEIKPDEKSNQSTVQGITTGLQDKVTQNPENRKKQDKEKELAYIKPTTDILKEIRTQAGYTQPELAKETEMTQQMVSRIDTNIINPRLSSFKRYLEACGVDLEEILKIALQNIESKNHFVE